MAWVWTVFLVLSVVFGIWTGKTSFLAPALLEGASAGVTLAISLAGPICLWSGLSHVMKEIGWMEALSKILSPVLKRLFPSAWQDREAKQALCGNLSANLLGLGNAATPLGIRAAKRMALNSNGIATKELCRLVVMNTASVQLIPATVASVRSSLGAAAPFDILPAVWLSSLFSVSMGLLAAWGFSRWAG